MGNPKVKWTSGEEKALITGVNQYGTGKWSKILKDPVLSLSFNNRNNIALKNKWRNMDRLTGQGSGEKATNNNGKSESSAPSSLVVHMDDDHPNTPRDVYNFRWCNNKIYDAISTLAGVNMPDRSAICNYIEQNTEPPLPTNFKRALTTRQRSLVNLRKPEMSSSPEPAPQEPRKTSSPEPTPQEPQKTSSPEPTPQEPRKTSSPERTPQEAEADNVAKLIAEAEKLSSLADEAVKEAESVSRIAEECEAMVELMNDIYAKCSEGEVIFFPGCQ